MTICNMSIEAGAKSSLVAFDSVTEDYVKTGLYSWRRKVEECIILLAHFKI